jgi:hypothetical protein
VPEVAVEGVGSERGFDHGIFEAGGEGHGVMVFGLGQLGVGLIHC